MAGSTDVSAVESAEEVDQSMHLAPDIRGTSVYQGSLDIHTTIEAQLPAEFPGKVFNIHGLRLDRVQDVDSDVDQIGENRRDVAAKVHPDMGPGRTYSIKHFFVGRPVKSTPVHGIHEKTPLATPVIREEQGIDSTLKPLINDCQVVFDNPVSQATEIMLIQVGVHEHILEPAEHPQPLEEGLMGREQIAQLAKADAKHFAELLRNWMSKR